MNGRLVIMGSGETAPTMVEVHRATLRAAGAGTSLLLDTPYGFQENADDITEKAVAYFGRNVGRTVTPLVWRTRLEGAALDRALTAVRTARSVFAGPAARRTPCVSGREPGSTTRWPPSWRPAAP